MHKHYAKFKFWRHTKVLLEYNPMHLFTHCLLSLSCYSKEWSSCDRGHMA